MFTTIMKKRLPVEQRFNQYRTLLGVALILLEESTPTNTKKAKSVALRKGAEF